MSSKNNQLTNTKIFFRNLIMKLKGARDFSMKRDQDHGLLPSRKDMGYSLNMNKQEFRDALCLRYGWNVPNMPHFCKSGQINTINHTLGRKIRDTLP